MAQSTRWGHHNTIHLSGTADGTANDKVQLMKQPRACLTLMAQQMAMLKVCLMIDLDGKFESFLTDSNGSTKGSPD
jgi:hypothetical protein